MNNDEQEPSVDARESIEPRMDEEVEVPSAPTSPTEPIDHDQQPDATAEPEPVPQDPNPESPQHPRRSLWQALRPELILFPALRRKLGSSARLVSILILAVLLVGIGGLSYWRLVATKQAAAVVGSFKAQHVQFMLVSTAPMKDATDVSTATSLTFNFNQAVNANKLINNVFITPTVNGSFKQGANPRQVIFAPAAPLTEGVKYSVMVNGTIQNDQGSQLGVPVAYGFTTSLPSNAVDFQDQNGLFDNVTSLASGQKEAYTLYFGNNVSGPVTVTLYKGSVDGLLTSLVYHDTTDGGYTYSDFSDPAVSTTGLSQVSATPNLKDQDSYNVNQPDGLYVAVATNAAGDQLGFVWVDISDFGVMVRQDDQKTILEAQTFSDSKDAAAQASFYNLKDSVNSLGEQDLNGLTTTNYGFSPRLDMVVAVMGNETAVVPVNIVDSGGDIRVDQDLSTTQAIYGITDKPTYKVGDTIRYAGYVRLDQDAQYASQHGGTVSLYVGTSKGSPLSSVSVSVDSNGMFSGSIPAASEWLTAGDSFDQFQLFASAAGSNPLNDVAVASFTVAATTNQTNNITVAFSKASYLPSDQITATIKGLGSTGQPLANASIQVHVFSEDYYENNAAANRANFGYFGDEVTADATTVHLDANGQATFTLDPTTLPSDGNSQSVTVQANLAGQTGVGAAGGDTAIVHQGNGYITFGPTRTDIPTGASLVSDVYLSQLSGAPMTNSAMQYSLVDTVSSQQLASGSATTDSNGFSELTIPASELATNGDGMTLKVTTKDQYGNGILSQSYYSVVDKSADAYDSSGAGLLDLSVTGTSGQVAVGNMVSITVHSPAQLQAMVTKDRGRIYQPAMVTLNQGDNNYSFTVTQDLAPSFTLTFSYFQNGVYHSEGVAFTVSEPSNQASVAIQAPGSVPLGQPVNVHIASTDNANNELPTNLIVEAISSNAYGLTNQVNPDIFSSLYSARPIMTSSSSSLSPVGSGGGRCGGGGAPAPSFANAVGSVLYWNPSLQTNPSGQATVSFTPTKGNWTIVVYAMSGDTKVGSQTVTLTAN